MQAAINTLGAPLDAINDNIGLENKTEVCIGEYGNSVPHG